MSSDPPELGPLASLVRAEASRATAETRIRPDPARIADGWERRFVVEARRTDEYVQAYEALGFETLVDVARADQVDEECGGCRALLIAEFRILYTRRRG